MKQQTKKRKRKNKNKKKHTLSKIHTKNLQNQTKTNSK